MAGTDYNLAASIFLCAVARSFCIHPSLHFVSVSYIIFEVPSQLLSKIYGPGKVLPIATVFFGLFSMCCVRRK